MKFELLLTSMIYMKLRHFFRLSRHSLLTDFWRFHWIECRSWCKYEIVPWVCHNSSSEGRASESVGGPYQWWGVTTCMRGGFDGNELLRKGQICWATHADPHDPSSSCCSCPCLCLLQRLHWCCWCTHQGKPIMLDMGWLCSLLNLW